MSRKFHEGICEDEAHKKAVMRSQPLNGLTERTWSIRRIQDFIAAIRGAGDFESFRRRVNGFGLTAGSALRYASIFRTRGYDVGPLRLGVSAVIRRPTIERDWRRLTQRVAMMVPVGVPELIRDDVVQEIVIGILEDEFSVADVTKELVGKHISSAYGESLSLSRKYRSLGAPVYSEERNGPSWVESLSR